MIFRRSRQLAGIALLLLASAVSGGPAAAAVESAAKAEPWRPDQVVSPRSVANRLKSKNPPNVLQIGFKELYAMGHVPGSRHVGPGSEPKGLAAIRKHVAGFPRDRELVLYCGCCPHKECANLLPAFKLLREMGFKKLRVIAMENDFNVDWKLKGLPVETGPGATAAPRG